MTDNTITINHTRTLLHAKNMDKLTKEMVVKFATRNFNKPHKNLLKKFCEKL